MAAAILFLPLLGAAMTGLFGRSLGDRASQILSCAAVIAAAVLAVPLFQDVVFAHHSQTIPLWSWIDTGPLRASFAIRLDALSMVMVMVVTVISALVHVYAIGYMEGDKGIPRFMSYLNLFTFAMLVLVTADNFLQLFLGWEGVGLASYLLIGFWFDRDSANDAAIKAFVVNRIGDFGFSLGIFAIFVLFGTLDFTPIFAAAPHLAGSSLHFLNWDFDALDVATLLLLMGAMGKSAQIGLHVWLADAMEGPTPVSALIHAATMVVAGVFMLCRLSPILEYAPETLTVIVVVGAATALFAATIALVQNDIKRIIAYSTCSQLGYMFLAAGLSAYPAAMFHLFTHAFFKALLFLAAGSVIHALTGEQDIRRMGGLWRKLPWTWGLMWVGTLALAGIPPFAGWWSKDAIIDSAFVAGGSLGTFAFAAGVLTALLTAFYSARLIFIVFHGPSHADPHALEHAHESPAVMMGPLLLLGLGSILAGWLGHDYFIGAGRGLFWGSSILVLPVHDVLAHLEQVPWSADHLTLGAGICGIGLAYIRYVIAPEAEQRLAGLAAAIYALLINKWYVDELYRALLVKPAFALGRFFWKSGDDFAIEGATTGAPVMLMQAIAARLSGLQTGYIFHYAFAMLVGLVGLLSWYLLQRVA